MRGIQSRKKTYVSVLAEFDPSGQLTPLAVVWADGRRFDIDRVVERRRAASLKVGGQGIRYLVEVGGRTTFLYYEEPAWFVEEIVAGD